MPGNIRVAVLEAIDLPSTVTDGKSVAVKVSVGRREFQTSSVEPQDGRTQPWNLEYLFPVLNLRDNLLVSLLDSKGDVVARAELETPGIVQKGFQDSFIALKAGGRIHVKVSFVLSEEERRKIEAMRLAATKKRKGLGQSFKSRRAPVSNVKITEISSEEAENLDTVPQEISKAGTRSGLPDDEDASGRGTEKVEELSRKHSGPKPELATTLKPDLPPKHCDVTAPTATDTATPASNPAAAEANSDSSRRKNFNWLSRRQHENRAESGVEKAEDSKWLEDLKLKSKIDKSTSAKAAKADEWIKNLDRSSEKAGSCKQEGLRSKTHSQEEGKFRDQVKHSQKTVKQKLEDWRAKELGPWRRTSKVRHASPPGSEHGTRWSLKHGRKHRIERELSAAQHPELMAATDKPLEQESSSSGSSSPSSSPANHRKVSGGVKNFVKQVYQFFSLLPILCAGPSQVLSGAAVVAGAIVVWPRRGSSKIKERYHIVQKGETLSSIVPDEWEDPDSNFYRLNPQIRDKHVIYPGQRIRLS
ncbi:uncharacterized protein LOC112345562 isoform X1 [Selaginella moellendorffii]|uniref:uncharacterized protein LOC112345562 isoform X1 n=1 Tax=Selaginella moellendorffii TaxID=88036 RepID=UPI000D1C40E9|nr:uncharacterized protein LOC112345562 isoform X1 [Selaginella moellendorffii]|eukprot:XP_024528376.1 uncharacterized protein LOC112345562 isoform X1 [Selaginella moellendorffii]